MRAGLTIRVCYFPILVLHTTHKVAENFHPIFGPILMVTYACLSNTLLLTGMFFFLGIIAKSLTIVLSPRICTIFSVYFIFGT